MAKLRVATIGAGYFSQFHHDAWSRIEDVALVAVCDRDRAKAAAFAERWSIPATYDDPATMLDQERPDLVDIATPPATHLALIRETAHRGLATICQKAFCRSLAEAEAAVAVAERAGILLVVHENFRFQPWHQEIRAQIEAGAIGDPYQATFRLRPGDGQGPRAYLDRQPYFQQMERFLIHETGIHFIDTFRFLFGEIDAVLARLRRLNPAISGEDAGIVLFEFASGMRALLDGNRLADHIAEDRRLTMGEMLIEGSKGAIRLDGCGRLFHRAFGENQEREIDYTWENAGFAGDSVLRFQRHVVDHLHGRGPLQTAARSYLTNLRIEDAIYRSSASGALQPVRR
jgi:D-apiose dehydrogenase